MTNAPEKRFRAGAISATIWQNAGQLKDGKQSSYNTISFSRDYKDKEGNWKSTSSLRANDLPKAVVVLNKAYEYLVTKSSSETTSEA
ncbi:hypothetical protein JW707_03710 [Candidatus Woesearchaeota archaeon]|nr:hypothetical protein [Candidatus Woesearchaeota archaeon]